LSIHRMHKGTLVYKMGVSTRCTLAKFDCLKADVVIAEEKYMAGRSTSSEKNPDGAGVDLRSTEFMFLGDLHPEAGSAVARPFL